MIDGHPYNANLGPGSSLDAFFKSSKLVTATGFFRLDDLFRDLTDSVLPALRKRVQSGARLNLLSAGCSDGWEPYSVAMTLKKYFDNFPLHGQRRFDITAIDVNQSMIKIAKTGVYKLMKDERKKLENYQDWFTITTDAIMQVRKPIKESIAFQVQDILTLKAPTPFNVIICTNILLYYEEGFKKHIVEKLARMLADGGYLYVESVGPRFMKSIGLQRIDPGSHFFEKIPD